MNEKLLTIVDQFAIQGTVAEIKPLGEGLINDTLLVKTAEAEAPNYVLQRVNTNVFPDVDMLMNNIHAVTTHIRKKLEARGEDDIDRKVLTFVPLKASARAEIIPFIYHFFALLSSIEFTRESICC